MPSKNKAQIPQAFLEYRSDFQTPCFDAWIPRNTIVSPVFLALARWGLQLRDVTIASSNNLEETSATFGLPKLGVQLQVAFGFFKLTVVNPDWSRADQILEVFDAAKAAVVKTVKVGILSQYSILALHITSSEVKQKEAVARVTEFKGVRSDDVIALGAGIYRKDSSLIIDKSAVFDSALFVRIERRHSADIEFRSIVSSIKQDELEALNMLGLEVEGL